MYTVHCTPVTEGTKTKAETNQNHKLPKLRTQDGGEVVDTLPAALPYPARPYPLFYPTLTHLPFAFALHLGDPTQ